jgi:hypothetical protein
MKEVFDKQKVSLNYYVKHLAPRDENGRILHRYGRVAILKAIADGRVQTEGKLILVESLKNL